MTARNTSKPAGDFSPVWACPRCTDTKFIWVPSLDGDSADKIACPSLVHVRLEDTALPRQD